MALAGTAHAGGYLGLGVHSEAGLGGDMDQHFSSSDHDGGRITLGSRIGRFAIEGSLGGTDLTSISGFGDRMEYSVVSAGVDGKMFFPLAAGGMLEAFGKLGLHRTWLHAESDAGLDHSGDSWAVGAGVQYGFNIGLLGGAAVLLDYTYQNLELADPNRRGLTGNVRTVSLGFQLGF